MDLHLPPLPVPFLVVGRRVMQDWMQWAYLPKPLGGVGGEGECDLPPQLWGMTTERRGRAMRVLGLPSGLGRPSLGGRARESPDPDPDAPRPAPMRFPARSGTFRLRTFRRKSPCNAEREALYSRRQRDGRRPMNVSPHAGKLAEPWMLVNVPRLMTAYYTEAPDPAVAAQRVAFGTSGHRGSAFEHAFNESHIVA